MAINVLAEVQALQETLSQAAKQSLDRRFGALFDKVYRKDVLWSAWRAVRRNNGGPGMDSQIRREKVTPLRLGLSSPKCPSNNSNPSFVLPCLGKSPRSGGRECSTLGIRLLLGQHMPDDRG